MIQAGSTIILSTKDAIYSPCKITEMSAKNITVTYFAGMKKDKKDGKMREVHLIDIVPRKEIVSMSERL